MQLAPGKVGLHDIPLCAFHGDGPNSTSWGGVRPPAAAPHPLHPACSRHVLLPVRAARARGWQVLHVGGVDGQQLHAERLDDELGGGAGRVADAARALREGQDHRAALGPQPSGDSGPRQRLQERPHLRAVHARRRAELPRHAQELRQESAAASHPARAPGAALEQRAVHARPAAPGSWRVHGRQLHDLLECERGRRVQAAHGADRRLADAQPRPALGLRRVRELEPGPSRAPQRRKPQPAALLPSFAQPETSGCADDLRADALGADWLEARRGGAAGRLVARPVPDGGERQRPGEVERDDRECRGPLHVYAPSCPSFRCP